MTDSPSAGEFPIGAQARLSRTIGLDDIQRMADITGDTNPIHLDNDFARKTRFHGRIAHGLFAAGLISAVLGTRLPGPGAVYLSQTLDFRHPVRAGDTLTAEVEVTGWQSEKRRITLHTRCFNQQGQDVVIGEAVLLVDRIGTDSE
jgi:acyl dehydratase